MILHLFRAIVIGIIILRNNVYAEDNQLVHKASSSEARIAHLVSKEVEGILINKLVDMENNILEKLTTVIDKKLNKIIQRYEELLLPNETLHFKNLNEKLDLIQNKMEEQAIKHPSKAQIIPNKTSYALVEINPAGKNYSQIVKRNNYVEVSVSWKTSACNENTKSIVTLDGRQVWSGTGLDTSAIFKLYKGGRYQMQIHLCYEQNCTQSDTTELLVVDTDGSHLPDPQTSPVKNYYQPTTGKILSAFFVEKNPITMPNVTINVKDIPFYNITQLMYGTIDICGAEEIGHWFTHTPLPSIKCDSADKFTLFVNSADSALIDSAFPNQNNYYNGSFGQMMMLKKEKPDLKILATIGGLLGNPFVILVNETSKVTFVNSAKEFLQTWKFFDGFNIVWLWRNSEQKDNNYLLVDLLQKLRHALDDLTQKTMKTYLLSITMLAEQETLFHVNYKAMNKYINNLYLLTYGIKSGWPFDGLGHQSGLYAPAWNPSENSTIHFATKYLIEQGVSNEKIVIDESRIGVGWTGVSNYTDDNPFTGVATDFYEINSNTVIKYKTLVDELAEGKWEYHYDDVAEASYLFREETGDLISYEDARSVTARAKYVLDNGLGGLFNMDALVPVYNENYYYEDILNAANMGLGNKLLKKNHIF